MLITIIIIIIIIIMIIIVIIIILLLLIIIVMITIMVIKITTIILTNHSPSGALQGQYKQIKINIGEKKVVFTKSHVAGNRPVSYVQCTAKKLNSGEQKTYPERSRVELEPRTTRLQAQ